MCAKIFSYNVDSNFFKREFPIYWTFQFNTRIVIPLDFYFIEMAGRFARDEAPLVIHPTETSIHEHFNNIIYRLNQRREEMIREFRERMEEKRAAATTRDNTIQQLIEINADYKVA